jgi:hypothetical protein
MSIDLEKELRRALRPVEPQAGFAARVAARIDAERRRRVPPPRLWAGAALAASLVLAVLGTHQWELQRERQGLEARAQLIQALRVTSEKLDLAYRGVSDASRAARPGTRA